MGLVRLSSAIRAKVIPPLHISHQQRLQPASTETRVGGSLICESCLGDFLALKVVGISQSDPLQNFFSPPANAEICLMKDQGKKYSWMLRKGPAMSRRLPICSWDPRKVNNGQKDYIDPSNTSNSVRGSVGALVFLDSCWWDDRE